MNYYSRVLVTVIFILFIIAVAFLWAFIAKKFEKVYLKAMQSKLGKSFIVVMTMIVQFIAILVVSIAKGFFIIDTLFVSCFLILGTTWLFSYFRAFNLNSQNGYNKYLGGGNFKVRLFKLRLNPFLVGIYSFSILGIIISFLYYTPYFL